MADLSVKVCGVEFNNPLIAASGTFGFGMEYSELYPLEKLGGISCKGITLTRRDGNPVPRVAETPSGILNAVGLQNPGVDVFINEDLPWLKKQNTVIIANIAGNTPEDYCAMAEKLSKTDVDMIELNISCPNVKSGGVQFGTSCESVGAITAAVKKYCKKPLIVKLSPNVTDIASIAQSAEANGADAISMINTLTGMRIDIKLIGRLKYRTSFGQNALTHSMEVAWLAGLLAGEMGVNVTLARRAGLLHDIGKALDHEIEGSHVQIGVDICRKYKENTQVIHAIEAHHGDVEPKTPLAFIIQACDAISAARPGARRENVESYVKRLENLEEISSSFEGVEQAFAVQAGREVRIMVKPDVISDDQVILLARSIAKKIEDTLDYPGQIKVNVIRESRAVEYAK